MIEVESAPDMPAESSPLLARRAPDAAPLQGAVAVPVSAPRLLPGGLAESFAEAVRSRDVQLQLSVLGGVPHPTNVGADLMFYRTLALGVAGGFTGATSKHLRLGFGDLKDVRLQVKNVEGRLRWYPLWDWLSLGATLGQEWLALDASMESLATTVTAKIRIRRTYLAPNLGLDWNIGKNLTLAAQLGVELPLQRAWSVDVDTSGLFGWVVDLAVEAGALDDLKKQVAAVARSPVPYLVLRVQWNI